MNKDSLQDSFEIPCVNVPKCVSEVDLIGYLLANPSIEKYGINAKEYFLTRGKDEGRAQYINTSLVASLRKKKLGKIKWKDNTIDTRSDNIVNYLTQEDISDFGIPADVPVSAHPYGPPITKLVRDNRNKLFLDLGAGLRHTYHTNVVNTDIYPFACTDVMCVGENMPFADEQFDFVFCFAVLEHTLRPWDVAKEISRVLKPGGKAFIDWPFLQPVHGYPHHYYNSTPQGNASLFKPYCEVESLEVGWHHHPAISVQWILAAWLNGLPSEIQTTFNSLTVGEIIKEPIEKMLSKAWCTELKDSVKKSISAGSMLTVVKRGQ